MIRVSGGLSSLEVSTQIYREDLKKIGVSLASVGGVKHLDYVWTRTPIKIECIVKTEGCKFTRFLKVTFRLVRNRGHASEL